LQAKLENYESFFPGKDFVLGYLTLADFVIAEASYYVEKIFPELFGKYSFLGSIRNQFENLEEIKTYYSQ